MRVFGKIAEICAALALLVLVVMTISAVFMRYFWNQPIQWTEEMSGFLMIWVVMLGAVVAERDRAHLTIPFVVDGLRKKLRTAVSVIISLISIALLLYMAQLGYDLAVKTEFKVTQILKISWYWIDIAVPIGAIGTAAFTLYWLIKDLTKKENDEESN